MILSIRVFMIFLLLMVHSFAIFVIASSLAGERFRWRRYLLFNLVYLVIEWLQIGLSLLVPGLAQFGDDPLWMKVMDAFLIIVLVCVIFSRMYYVAIDKAFAIASLGHFLTYTIIDFLTEAAYFYSPVFDGGYLFVVTTLFVPYILTLAVIGGIAYALHKTEFSKYFSYLFQGRVRTAVTLVICFALIFMKIILDFIFSGATVDFAYGLLCFSLIIIVLFCIQFGAMYAASADKVRAQEETIAQQQAHMELLEELQGEIRAFRHDFTNLISGMALSAQEGDLDAIQEFMQRTSGYFDEKLGNEIKQMEGLANIEAYPLRSLLSTKLGVMRQKRIHVALEIMNPVTRVKMPTEDLLRCQGILLDNAIEAAAKEEGKIRIVLLQDHGELYIAIANNYDEQPDLGALGKGNYTTKGKGHGTGLSSYWRIVSRCSDCMMRTYLKDGFFVQELRIPVC